MIIVNSAINYKDVGDGNMRREKSYQTIIYFFMITLTFNAVVFLLKGVFSSLKTTIAFYCSFIET